MKNYTTVKLACYTSNISMSVVSALPPLLFLTFRESYGISFSLLGLLVLVSFVTQLIVDLLFSFFSHKFNIELTVRAMPFIFAFGLIMYAAAPVMFADAVYLGLVLGTVLFSASAGLGEVLISPVIAAIPSKNPEHEMSKLHSVFAWGSVAVIILSTLFILFVGDEYWQWLVLIFTLVPVSSAVLFSVSKLPTLSVGEKATGTLKLLSRGGVWLCIIAIFLGGASECTMSQWASSYIEAALGIPKIFGDIFGVALFSVSLGVGRTLYSKFGKRIERVLLLSAMGAALCYLVAILSPIPLIGLIACALTGLSTAMLWPGSLIVASDRFPESGVVIYALMAAGGDLGASVAPQLVGVVTDAVMSSELALSVAEGLGLGVEQLSMKAGLSVGMLFPLCAIVVFLIIYRQKKKASVAK
ncbi:MAG: MFS transporter [Clostridia bacterium]|nr:MFS transporter [Clostridia bacterium]